MCRKKCLLFDVIIFALLVILCQTLYRMHTIGKQSFCPLFIAIAKEDTTFTQKELSRFFLYLSNLMKPKTQTVEVPLFLTQLDTLSDQLARAHHTAHSDRYSDTQRQQFLAQIAELLSHVEATAHEYLKERTSARLLTPHGLSTHITTSYENTKNGLALTQQAHELLLAMELSSKTSSEKIDSVEQGLQENEHILQRLAL